jgi:transposase
LSERRKFTREFKVEAIKPVIEGSKSLRQVSQELDIRLNVLQRWRDEYLADPEQAFPGSGQLKPEDAEIARLKRELKQTQMERNILKKAIAIFSKEPK